MLSTTVFPVSEARAKLSDIIDDVDKKSVFTLTRGGKPKAVIVNIEMWEKMNKDLRDTYQKTFITPANSKNIRSFTKKEVSDWLENDRL